jgi:hypothetical protein
MKTEGRTVDRGGSVRADPLWEGCLRKTQVSHCPGLGQVFASS